MKLVIIGTGNVATALGKAFLNAGHTIVEVAGRSPVAVKKLATRLHAKPIYLPAPPTPAADCYIIAVKDDAIPDAAACLINVTGVCAHTSGTVPLSVLGKAKQNTGVFYPVNTIRNNQTSSFRDVPICIEGKSEKTTGLLLKLAASISPEVYQLNSKQRATLHLAAVFANNFTNHINAIALGLLRKHKLPETLLYPLIRSTAQNAISPGPEAAQTGPAIRNDIQTLQKHREMLKRNKELLKIYNILTTAIRSSGGGQ